VFLFPFGMLASVSAKILVSNSEAGKKTSLLNSRQLLEVSAILLGHQLLIKLQFTFFLKVYKCCKSSSFEGSEEGCNFLFQQCNKKDPKATGATLER